MNCPFTLLTKLGWHIGTVRSLMETSRKHRHESDLNSDLEIYNAAPPEVVENLMHIADIFFERSEILYSIIVIYDEIYGIYIEFALRSNLWVLVFR